MRKYALAAVWVLIASRANAATLNVIGGILHGASGVDVGGTLYDVEFLDGTCIGLFSGCDDVSDFTFTNASSAIVAAQALLDQVFLDGPSGSFDSTPPLISGCSDGLECRALTPYQPQVFAGFITGVARNYSSLSSSPADTTGLGPALFGAFPGPDQTWARWSTAAIPEPSTALLLAIGLGGMAGGRRR